MEEKINNSSQIEKIKYDGGMLTVTFKKGTVYEYYEVPEEVVTEMVKSEAPGKYFASMIRGTYKYKKVT